LQRQLARKVDFETFFAQAPAFNPNSALLKGVVCGVRVEDIDDPLMQRICYLDKLIDELAKRSRWTRSFWRNDPMWDEARGMWAHGPARVGSKGIPLDSVSDRLVRTGGSHE
jgi:hypothetical protein